KAYYNNISGTAGRESARDAWQSAARQFDAIYRANPDHELAPTCLFILGQIHEQKIGKAVSPADLDKAITCYRDLANRFPGHNLADDALLAMATIQEKEQEDVDEAAKTYARIVALYPKGDMYPTAVTRLRQLKPAPVAKRAAVRKKLPPPPLSSATKTIPQPTPPLATVPAPAARPIAAAPVPPVPPALPAIEEALPPAAPFLSDLAIIQPLKHWSNNDYTRIVIETSKTVEFNKSLLPKRGDLPRRLFVDFKNCRISRGLQSSMPIGDGLLKQVRTAQYSPDTVRVVLDIESLSDYKIFSLQDPFRVVIDVMGARKPEVKETVMSTRKKTAPAISLAQQLGLGIRRVVIDAGHGGKDPGAVAPCGLKEKDVTLAVARQVAEILRRDLQCEVVMTRDRDVFVPLEERTAIANTRKGDLFLSIHVNAAPTARAKGIETYFLDLATTPEAMLIAARENATSTRQMNNLQAILQDLIRNTKINESARLATYVQENMVTGLSRRYTDVGNLGVKRAPFVVLIGAQMPSILTEIAFLSNPEEVKRLNDPQYLTAVAEELVAGVSRYAKELNIASLQLE
ncbi:MAG: N-acetylmuramoyl-L-alanine amidase, partial [Desulfobulbaceae bacterium]|nr:N-acetylmuramoyl-L-alanine amidase [Desulfobulbaceae bacterium]